MKKKWSKNIETYRLENGMYRPLKDVNEQQEKEVQLQQKQK